MTAAADATLRAPCPSINSPQRRLNAGGLWSPSLARRAYPNVRFGEVRWRPRLALSGPFRRFQPDAALGSLKRQLGDAPNCATSALWIGGQRASFGLEGCRTMDVSMEKSIGRAIGFMVIVITVFVVGEIWQPDDPVQDQVGAQEDMESGSQPASQLAPPASQPGGDQSPTDGQQAAASG